MGIVVPDRDRTRARGPEGPSLPRYRQRHLCCILRVYSAAATGTNLGDSPILTAMSQIGPPRAQPYPLRAVHFRLQAQRATAIAHFLPHETLLSVCNGGVITATEQLSSVGAEHGCGCISSMGALLLSALESSRQSGPPCLEVESLEYLVRKPDHHGFKPAWLVSLRDG